MWNAIVLFAVVLACIACTLTVCRAAEARFRRSEARYRELVDTLPHFLYRLDAGDRYVAINTTVAEYFGCSVAGVVGKTAIELGIPPEVANLWTEQNARVRASGATLTVDIVSTVNGVTRHIRNTISPTRDDDGRINGVTGIGIDITEQKNAEASTRRLLSAVEQLDEVLFMTDAGGRILYVNPAFERVYGYTRDEVLGQTPRIIKSGELCEDDYQSFWSELLAGRSVRIEYRNRAKSGALVDVIGTATPVMDGDAIAGFVAVHQDVTERRRTDERLQRIAKLEALGTLAGGIAHDFNNILAIVMSHVELVERVTPRESRAAPAIQTVKQAVRRGGGLARQILTFARRADVALAETDVAPLVRELAAMLIETLPRTIAVRVAIDGKLPRVMADAGQLHQALLNLCLNARDAMPNGGTLRIAAHLAKASMAADEPPSDCLCIVVADDGTGIDATTRQRIFEPFFTTKAKGQGTGLGLAVVHGIVNAHQGFIDLDSQPGAGTVFRIYLPIAQVEAQPARAESPLPELQRGTETLLVIDDEPAILDCLEAELSSRGYRVLTACDGPHALEVCGIVKEFPDAIVTDLGMPKMPAADLILALRKLAPRVPVVGMTGYVDPAFHASILAAGAERIMQKPFEVDDLLRELRGLMDGRVKDEG